MTERHSGRHRAEDITHDLTVENLALYRAYREMTRRTKYVGHLGVPGRHEAPAQ